MAHAAVKLAAECCDGTRRIGTPNLLLTTSPGKLARMLEHTIQQSEIEERWKLLESQATPSTAHAPTARFSRIHW